MAKNTSALQGQCKRGASLAENQQVFKAFLNDATRAGRIVWLHFRAPWSELDHRWESDVFAQPAIEELRMRRFSYFAWDADVWPELDNAAQVLVQNLSGRESGWPLHVFFEPRSGKPVIGCSAMNADSFGRFLTDLANVYSESPVALTHEAELNANEGVGRDPLRDFKVGSGTEKSVEKSVEKSLDALKSSFLVPLLQSIDYTSGLFGGRVSFLHPAAYGVLLREGSTDAPHTEAHRGEVALARLCRGPLCDVVGGGFFRSLDAGGVMECEKLLHQNAEMLWVLSEAVAQTRSPFLLQTLGETLRSLAEDFYDVKTQSFWGALAAPQSRYEYAPPDLLEALSGNERGPAQKFFGIEARGNVPRLQDDVSTLAREWSLAPIDLRNTLATAQKKLRLYRELRPGLRFETATPWQRDFTLAALYRCLRLHPSLATNDLVAKLVAIDHARSDATSAPREQACRLLVQVERHLFATTCAQEWRGAPADFSPERLEDAMAFCDRLSLVETLPLFSKRYSLFDHLGLSGATLQLLAAQTFVESAPGGLKELPSELTSLRADLDEKIREALLASRRLGLNGLSSFWIASH